MRYGFCFIGVLLLALTLAILAPVPAPAEVMLQWFESEWDEVYRRLPEVAEIGYDYMWIPPPTKSPTGKGTIWANVGYNLYDRFDIGDVPQRGSLATRYGTRGSLENMVKKAHQMDVKIIPDIVMNHNGNGPDFREYPGMKAEDFHVTWHESYVNTLNYNRARRMDQWDPKSGYGGTLWQELAQLIDIRTEDHDLNTDRYRFSGDKWIEGHNFNFVAGGAYTRHPGQYEKYPDAYGDELAADMLYRWIVWLGNAIDYDGLRLDAGKHVPYEFFGYEGSGFLHEAHENYTQRRGVSDDGINQLFDNYLSERDDALIFAEILSPWNDFRDGDEQGCAWWFDDNNAGNDRNPMRFLDYAMKKHAGARFNGDLNGLGAVGSDFGANNGITYVWGHDEGPPGRANLAYAYILTHIGMPMVYFTGSNIKWENFGRNAYDPNNPNLNKTWMIPGHDSQALGDVYGDISNLVWIHQNFAWGAEHKLYENHGDYFALERYDDADSNGRDAGDAIMVMALNDSGGDIGRDVETSFEEGTVLKDYAGNNLSDATVGAGGWVHVTVPGTAEQQNWVCYAPYNISPVGVTFSSPLSGGVTNIDWIVPGGAHAADKTNSYTRIVDTNFAVTVTLPGGKPAGDVLLKWGQGKVNLAGNTHHTNRNDHRLGNFEQLDYMSDTEWKMDVTITDDNIPEGLNVVKVRVFNSRDDNLYPQLFNTVTKTVYVDRRGPELEIQSPAAGEMIYGDAVMLISNPDYTAFEIDVTANGVTHQALEVMKGLWKCELKGLPTGPQLVTVTAREADWDEPRKMINQSVYTRSITVGTAATIGLVVDGGNASVELPFFTNTVSAPGASDVRLYWDGYRLPFNAGSLTNLFNGQVVFDGDPLRVETQRLWGAFVNAEHFFEAVRIDGAITSRAVARVTFNLYGNNHIDSDGDGLPDTVEMPYFNEGAPGPDQAWPGDDNDFIPEPWETWTRLNPYNHATFYTGEWDDQGDFDGDEVTNGDEVRAGYHATGNIYQYSIYDPNSKPAGSVTTPSEVTWGPQVAARGGILSITNRPNQGPLDGESPIHIHVGHSFRTQPEWQDVTNYLMTASGNEWIYDHLVPSNATSVDFVFRNAAGTLWDNNNQNNWQVLVAGDTNRYFDMDGGFDGAFDGAFTVFPGGTGLMRIDAAVRGENLYVATVGAGGNTDDHFVLVSDELGDAHGAPWAKAGVVFFDTATKPFLAGNAESNYQAWHNIAGGWKGNFYPGALEGEINLVDVFGYVPEAVYVAALAYGKEDSNALSRQGPYAWDSGGNVDIMEFLRLPVASITDEDADGYFDAGKPQLWTAVGGDTNDANYGLRRFFIDETAGETADLTVILKPHVGLSNSVSHVELFSNINRRDFAVMEEDPDTVYAASLDRYYRAYPMTYDAGSDTWRYTITIKQCGAYRLSARYKVNGSGDYTYYTDSGLRRDCAVVVSPRKALQLTMYEMNPMFIEATNDNFYGRSTFGDLHTVNVDRPDRVNTSYFSDLGVNMIWLQPMHPIGADGKQIDPATDDYYDPGSPYAVQNYWKVNSVLGDPSNPTNAMQEFLAFVAAMDSSGVGVMLDGTFNHSAWDCEIGVKGVEMGITTNATDLIRDVRPAWYSKRDAYGAHATYYQPNGESDIAVAPDRIDFGKWTDAADFNFGRYDALVQEAAGNTNDAWSSSWNKRFLLEEDRFEGHDDATRELWSYFAAYPLYWLEKTGHPQGTPKSESYRGIDGLRCDFAQGLPSAFWEYCINKTRQTKWDFVFMAESLDGYTEVAGSKRHGVGYRSARHFDVLNENLVFYWRNEFFNYPHDGCAPGKVNYAPKTSETRQALDDRRDAYDASPVLLNLSSHDEVYPSHDPWRLFYAYVQLAAVDGVPMILYGQELGAQNDHDRYHCGDASSWIPDASHNFAHYELNFGKSIPNFKRFNHMMNIWDNATDELVEAYQRVNNARLSSPALKSQGVYFLEQKGDGYDDEIFAVAKFEQAGVSAATQDVVFAFANNHYWDQAYSNDVSALFEVDKDFGSENWFGIDGTHSYNVVDLLSTNPSSYLWGTPKTGQTIFDDGLYVRLQESPTMGSQAQYIKLVDLTDAGPGDSDMDGLNDWQDPDDDNDGLPDSYEIANGLNPTNATGLYGWDGDKDGDTISNGEEMIAGTDPDEIADYLRLTGVATNPVGATVTWRSVSDINYTVEHSDNLLVSNGWVADGSLTAVSSNQVLDVALPSQVSNRFWRVKVVE
jgi:glycosidase